MTSVIFVHGTGVRQPQYVETFQLIQKHLGSAVIVVLYVWGEEFGVKLNAQGASIPLYDASLALDPQPAENSEMMSMNSTGREFSQADLIRNYILMGLEPQLQTQLYEQYWRPMEVEFGQEGYGTHFDGFMRHFLIVKTGNIPNQGEVYEAFKAHARSPEVAKGGVEALVADIRTFARYYCAMTLGAEPDPDLKREHVTFEDA